MQKSQSNSLYLFYLFIYRFYFQAARLSGDVLTDLVQMLLALHEVVDVQSCVTFLCPFLIQFQVTASDL